MNHMQKQKQTDFVQHLKLHKVNLKANQIELIYSELVKTVCASFHVKLNWNILSNIWENIFPLSDELCWENGEHQF